MAGRTDRPAGAAVVELMVVLPAVAIVAAVVLQVPQQVGLSAGEVLQGGFSTVILVFVWLVYRRQDQREREAAVREEAASKKRQDLHDRIDKVLFEMTSRAERQADQYGRLEERSDMMREDLIGISARIDGVGSKIAAQTEKALFDRADKPIERLETRLDNLIQAMGKQREGA